MTINRFLPALLAAGLLLGGPAYAAKGDNVAGAIDARTFDQLMQAQELTEAGQHAEALKVLDGLKASGKLNGYAQSQMYNFYAFIYANQENYPKAIDAYKQVLGLEDATEGLKLTAKYSIAQMYFQIEDYQACIRFMEDWLKQVDTPTPTAHIMLAQAYYQTEAYDKALSNVSTASKLEAAAGKPIPESWLRLTAALYYAKNDYAKTARVYEELIRRYPKLSYLKQLAGMYSELGQDKKRLAAYDAVYEHGALSKEAEVLNLAYMYLGQDVPYKAGKIIEAGMNAGQIEKSAKNVETLANAWAAASEYKKAVPALQQAAKMSDKGLLYARLAGVYFDAGDYAEAAKAARNADQKGGLKNSASNLMLLGMANFNDKQYEDALQAFRRAKKDKSNYAAAAQWEDYTMAEIQRIKALEQAKFELQKRTEQTIQEQQDGEAVIEMRDE